MRHWVYAAMCFMCIYLYVNMCLRCMSVCVFIFVAMRVCVCECMYACVLGLASHFSE